MRALAATKQLSSLAPGALAQFAAGAGLPGQPAAPGSIEAGVTAGLAGAAAAAGGGERGTQEMPLHVLWSESPRAQLWRLIRLLAVGGMAIAAFMLLVDEKSLPKGLGIGTNE
eukprot:743864-Prymnesium_polylepis.1